jgi:hypothetical protein
MKIQGRKWKNQGKRNQNKNKYTLPHTNLEPTTWSFTQD